MQRQISLQYFWQDYISQKLWVLSARIMWKFLFRSSELFSRYAIEVKRLNVRPVWRWCRLILNEMKLESIDFWEWISWLQCRKCWSFRDFFFIFRRRTVNITSIRELRILFNWMKRRMTELIHSYKFSNGFQFIFCVILIK